MNDEIVHNALKDITEYISMSRLAKSVGKDKSWLYHKLNNDTINGVEYRFNAMECALLSEQLHALADNIRRCAEALDNVVRDENRTAGRFYTNGNVFEYSLFQEWIANIPDIEKTTILEPFAGECSIIKMLPSYKWGCYDIEPHKCDYKVVKRDTIQNFPKGYRVCITNPPYLARNSATRRKLSYPQCEFDNLYKHCLQLMLDNCQYVAAIIPDSYIQSGLFTERLYGVISIPEKVFVDTEFPVCLAMFNPKQTNDFQIWKGGECLGSLGELSAHNLNQYKGEVWKFNDTEGEIGIICLDGKKSRINFVKGSEVTAEIKCSSRSFARISGLPEDVNCDAFIKVCNEILEQYRVETKDVFLTSTKGLGYNGSYRKRISFSIVRSILTYALEKYNKNI